jgi:hypothetical protein
MLFKKISVPVFAALLILLTACVRAPSTGSPSGDCSESGRPTNNSPIILDNPEKK